MSAVLPHPALDALQAADRDARALAQREFRRPLVLEAGAGTGKTTTLVARVLAWSLGPGWERAEAAEMEAAQRPGSSGEAPGDDRVAARVLRGVVAITFTEAAAAEMASRVARAMAAVAGGLGTVPPWLDVGILPPPAERVRRARALLATLDHLAVSTIHAFCRGLLAAHPLEAGVHPGLVVDADGAVLDEVVRETVEAALREGYGEPGDPHLLALAACGFGPREIVEALALLARDGLPAAALAEDPLQGEGFAALRSQLATAARRLHALLAPRLRGRVPNAQAIAQALAALLDLIEADGTEAGGGILGPAALREAVTAALPENLLGHLKKWRKRDFGQAEAACLGDVAGGVEEAAGELRRAARHLAALDPELLTAARLALGPLLARVEEELRTRGAATFESLLSGAERLLARHPEVRQRLRSGVDQLLVDEFQDTDLLQCAILGWLALDGPEKGRPGLFLVGDPKQSVYGWRNADLRAYESFVRRVCAAGGEVRRLAESFRSVPAVLAEVERAVGPVMRSRPGLQPEFQSLFASAANRDREGFARAGRRPVEHWVSWLPEELAGTRAAAATELEAAALARDLRHLHDREGVRWAEFGILLRSLGDLDIYLEALRAAGVPFQVGRDRQYYRRREVIEAAALVRAVLDPGDHLALLTLLRSALVGVPDAALVPLWGKGLPSLASDLGRRPDPAEDLAVDLAARIAEAARELPAGVPGLERVRGWEASLAAAAEHLTALRHSFAVDPADLFVEKVRRLFLLEPTEAARYLGPYRLANLERFFRRLLQALEEGGGDAGAILRVLRRSVAESLEAEEGRPEEGAEDAVQVLTIHGAKGLDFEHVYLVQTHKQPPPEREAGTAVGRQSGRFEYRLFGAATPGFGAVAAEREEVEAAERVRTLYVALTRAKSRVVVAGLWPAAPQPCPPERARTHLELLGNRAGVPPIAELWNRLAHSSMGTALDDTGALWRFPALDPSPADAADGEDSGLVLPSAAEVGRAAAALAERRAAARRRMARPFSAAASEEAHERLRELLAEHRFGEGQPPAPAESEGAEEPETPERRRTPRDAALASGTAVHRALEAWDLSADPEAETASQLERLPAYLAALALNGDAASALARARDLLARFASGPLLPRLRGLHGHIVARELPVLLPPAGDSDADPVGFISGAVDLLYRDPETNTLVIADFKTDDVETEADLRARAAAYAPQGALYTRAVREALGLAELPRFELWFLAAGTIVATG